MCTFKKLQHRFKEYSLILKQDEALAKHSTIGIGGNARLLVSVNNSRQLEKAIMLAITHAHRYIIIGKGSNIIFTDSGYDGLVIINTSKKWKVIGKLEGGESKLSTKSRFKSLQSEITANYDDANSPDIRIRADSGVRIDYLRKAMYKEGITGLEWFAGIPSTVGGAIYMNMHGGEYFFGDLVEGATITNGQNKRRVDKDYFKFDYDWSIFHKTNEIILEADLRLKRGEIEKAQLLAKKWAKAKSFQPRRSAGCIFRNLSTEEQSKLNLPTSSVGYIIDQVLELKGMRIGDAIISPRHAAFIENLGQATAHDVLNLIELVKREAKSKLGVELKEEIQIIGK
jgi:UDP-N-acetylmuramate dehydrogenase